MSGYKCNHCSKTYKLKYNLDRHIQCCQFLHKTQIEKEIEIDDETEKIPNQEEMYKLIKDMALKIYNLESEIKKLKQTEKKKIQYLDWLNNHSSDTTPSILFSEWLNTSVLSNVHKYLEIVYQTDLLNGMNKLLEDAVSTFENNRIPICVFDKKPNVFYIYKTVIEKQENTQENKKINKWICISNNDFDTYLSIISHQFLVDFNIHWYAVNKEKMEIDEQYKDIYVSYYKNILGGDKMSDEIRYMRIRQNLYNNIKKNVKTIFEYDVC